jgi:TP901 family phage tail tape measure protein
MAGEVGVAYVSIVPSTKGFGSTLNRQVQKPVSTTGRDTGRRFGSAFGLGVKALGAGALVGAGLGVIAKGAVSAEADFSQTMATLAAATGTPKAGIKALTDLALKFGADTVFSAGEAANAMLELAKGGLTTAQIRAGALSETLTLAAASGASLETSATILSNAMNTFGLSAKDTPKITAALAGGANSSTASIESLGQALQQVGPGAKSAGLTINDTVGVLAAFDNAGIKGSDAGTSLKTMLARLVPQSKRAAGAMRSLGVDFTDAEGNFLPIVDVAAQLKTALADVSDAERTSALNKIFGADASRAAGVLADLGGGVGKYIKATKDMNAAQDIAKARMSGTKGALEQLRGSFETAQLRIGQALAPAIQKGAGFITKALNGLADYVPKLVKKLTDPFGTFQTEIVPRLRRFWGYLKNTLGPGLAEFAKAVIPDFVDAVKSIAGSVKGVLDTFNSGDGKGGKFNTTLLVLRGTAKLVSAMFKIAATNVKLLAGAFKLLTFIPKQLAGVAVAIVGAFIRPILNAFGKIVTAAATAFGWVPILGPKLRAASDKFAAFKTRAFAALDGFGAKGTQLGAEFTSALAAAILGGNSKVAPAVAQGTANKVRANATALLGADSRRTGGAGSINVTVNNPKPERASESTPTAIARATRAAGWAAA